MSLCEDPVEEYLLEEYLVEEDRETAIGRFARA